MALAGPAIESGAIFPGSQGQRARIVSIITHVSELDLDIGTGGVVDTGVRPDELFDFQANPIDIGRLMDTRDLTNLYTWPVWVTADKPAVDPVVQFLGVDQILDKDLDFSKQHVAMLVNNSDVDAIIYPITTATVIAVSATESAIPMLSPQRLDVAAFNFVLPYRVTLANEVCKLRCKGT